MYWRGCWCFLGDSLTLVCRGPPPMIGGRGLPPTFGGRGPPPMLNGRGSPPMLGGRGPPPMLSGRSSPPMLVDAALLHAWWTRPSSLLGGRGLSMRRVRYSSRWGDCYMLAGRGTPMHWTQCSMLAGPPMLAGRGTPCLLDAVYMLAGPGAPLSATGRPIQHGRYICRMWSWYNIINDVSSMVLWMPIIGGYCHDLRPIIHDVRAKRSGQTTTVCHSFFM